MKDRRGYTVAEFCFAYGMKRKHVARLIHDGSLRAINVGSRQRPIYRILASAIERFERELAA